MDISVKRVSGRKNNIHIYNHTHQCFIQGVRKEAALSRKSSSLPEIRAHRGTNYMLALLKNFSFPRNCKPILQRKNLDKTLLLTPKAHIYTHSSHSHQHPTPIVRIHILRPFTSHTLVVLNTSFSQWSDLKCKEA